MSPGVFFPVGFSLEIVLLCSLGWCFLGWSNPTRVELTVVDNIDYRFKQTVDPFGYTVGGFCRVLGTQVSFLVALFQLALQMFYHLRGKASSNS